MNIKINKERYLELCQYDYKEYLFGSRLHGIATENSDWDYIRIISDDFYNNFKTVAHRLPNIHSFQYDDKENNTQYVWMTEQQFYHNLFSGDGNMVADVVLLSGEFDDSLFLCKTYKIIKGYLGVAKRDLKLHGKDDKKRFHAWRSLYMAGCLIDNKIPEIKDIIKLKSLPIPTTPFLFKKEVESRIELNLMLNKGEIEMYPNFKEDNELVKIMLQANNTREFRYE